MDTTQINTPTHIHDHASNVAIHPPKIIRKMGTKKCMTLVSCPNIDYFPLQSTSCINTPTSITTKTALRQNHDGSLNIIYSITDPEKKRTYYTTQRSTE